MKDAYRPEIVQLGDGITEKDLVVHDEKGPNAYSMMLADMKSPEFPLPVGVIRRVDAPVFDAGIRKQVEEITTLKGRGDLQKALYSDNTWEVR